MVEYPSIYEKLSEPRGLAIIDICDYCNHGGIITRINVPPAHRGRGIASRLLATGGLDFDTLRDWYSKNGFKDRGGIYCRAPRQQP